jgi:metal-responsive CopG/Arc/MetJ family transcriptional regulator
VIESVVNVSMVKTKTSITIDEDLWKEWQIFVIEKTGKARKVSDETESALREYMKNHKNKENANK